jgi:outer membrane protein assembly factor BamB
LLKFTPNRSTIAPLCILLILFLPVLVRAQSPGWSAKLDGRVRFYQSTELGVLIIGTEKSLYAVDDASGDVLWRRKHASLDETDVAPVPGTDLLLLTLEDGSKSRLEATDIMTGEQIWRSDKVRGAVMQAAFDPASNRLAVVLARDAKGSPRDGFKRKPVAHMFDVASGRELWKYEVESDVEMMPSAWNGEDGDKVPYTLNNYRPPVFLDNRLYLFYDGVTSLDVETGNEKRREKFRINEEGLALTDADPVADESAIYLAGRGHVRAVSRLNGEVLWESKDLGTVPELILTRGVLFARTGGQFTRLKDGEIVERGPFGVSAVDLNSGKVLWRYKGADKGITNIALADPRTIVLADHDDLITVDTASGKRQSKFSHKVDKAAFVLINESGQAVVGGIEEIAGFNISDTTPVWRSRHSPPGRGILRTVAAIAARAAALYFRYGGVASTAFRGVQVLNTLNSIRWSGLSRSVALPNLTTLASNYAHDYARERFEAFGALSRVNRSTFTRSSIQPRVTIQPRVSVDVEDRLLDRVDPAHQLERLSSFLWRRRKLAALRGQYMYFYTDIGGGSGLLGVNINTGTDERAVRVSNPDERFIADEATGLLFLSRDNRMMGLPLGGRH